MERNEIIKELKQWFGISELVCNHTMQAFGDKSWQFLDTELLHTLLILRRDIFKCPITINTDTMKQRGLRCNICQLVKDKTMKNQIYLSAHCNGAAVDLDVKGFSAEQSRSKIKAKANLLPYPIRLEEGVTWVHIDVYDSGSLQKISTFNS